MNSDSQNPKVRTYKDALIELGEIKSDSSHDKDQARQVEIYLESKRNFLNLEEG